MHNKANPSTPVLHDNSINNLASAPDLEPLITPYWENQPTDPQLWNGNFSLVSLFGTDEFLIGNAKNIACSL